MPRHLLPAFCLSLLLGCACGPARAGDDGPARGIPLFAAGTTKVPENMGSEDPKRDVSSFDSPFLVGGNGVMVAFAETQYTGGGNKNTGIVARYFETEGPNWAVRATEYEGNWKHQLVLKAAAVNHSVLRSPTAGFLNNKIYLLALSNWTNDSSQSGNGWQFELSVGAITGEVGNKTIEWESSVSLRSKLTEMVKKNGWKVFPGSNNSALLTSKGTIVFSVNAKNRENTSGFAILQLKDDEEQWELSFIENPEECRVFSVFEWEEKLISVFSGCATHNTHVREYNGVKKEWKKVDDTPLRVWNFFQALRDSVSVTIGNKNVLLFTEEGYLKRFPDGGQSAIRLGFTDGFRVHDAHILTLSSKATSGGLLYINGELFFIYKVTRKRLENIVFKRLDDELRRIKSKLNSWAKKDAYLPKPCNETTPEGASADSLCVTPMPTDGLVGFLSNRGVPHAWYGEYGFWRVWVNGTKVNNGYTFSEAHDGVRWPLLGTYSGKRDDFMKYGLTVVATVTIHKAPEGYAPLLTVGEKGLNERLGLWCEDGKCKIVSRIGGTEPYHGLVTNITYKMALVVKDDKISAYVNGFLLGGPLRILAPGTGPFDISEIFIGGYGHARWLNMTVTNVFLYNRVLNNTELEAASRTISTNKRKDVKEKFETPKKIKEATQLTPELTNKAKAAPEPTNNTEPVAEPTNKTESAPEATNKTESVPESTNRTESVPEATNKTKPVTEPTNKAESALDATNKTETTPAPTNLTETTPAPTSTTEMPRDPEDGSVCVRMSFASLFLLGCFCLVIF